MAENENFRAKPEGCTCSLTPGPPDDSCPEHGVDAWMTPPFAPGPDFLPTAELAEWLVDNGYAEAKRGYGHASGDELAHALVTHFEVRRAV